MYFLLLEILTACHVGLTFLAAFGGWWGNGPTAAALLTVVAVEGQNIKMSCPEATPI